MVDLLTLPSPSNDFPWQGWDLDSSAGTLEDTGSDWLTQMNPPDWRLLSDTPVTSVPRCPSSNTPSWVRSNLEIIKIFLKSEIITLLTFLSSSRSSLVTAGTAQSSRWSRKTKQIATQGEEQRSAVQALWSRAGLTNDSPTLSQRTGLTNQLTKSARTEFDLKFSSSSQHPSRHAPFCLISRVVWKD